MKRILITVALTLATLAQAHSYRVFYLVREHGVIHGDHTMDDGSQHPYHYTADAPSKAAARRELLRQVPNAAQIEINDLGWD
jgi:hypothetical protein